MRRNVRAYMDGPDVWDRVLGTRKDMQDSKVKGGSQLLF